MGYRYLNKMRGNNMTSWNDNEIVKSRNTYGKFRCRRVVSINSGSMGFFEDVINKQKTVDAKLMSIETTTIITFFQELPGTE